MFYILAGMNESYTFEKASISNLPYSSWSIIALTTFIRAKIFLFLLLTLLVQYSFEFWNYHCQLVNLGINQSVWLTWNEMIVVRFTTGSTDRNVNWDTSDIKQACMPTTQNISIILTWIWVHIWVFKKTVYCILIHINTKYNFVYKM